MRQTSFFKSETKEHGGALSIKRRRSRRVLSTRESLHVMLRSDFATGRRALCQNQGIINTVIKWAEHLYRVKVYCRSIGGNHMHLLLRGKTRVEIQNFFRVMAGHTALRILAKWPLSAHEKDRRKTSQSGAKKISGNFGPC